VHEIDTPAESAAVPAEESTNIATMPTDPARVFSAEEVAAPRPSALRNAFFGADGLRAGWGLLLFIAILAASIAAVQWTQHAIRHRHAAQAASSTASPAKSSGKSGSTAADAARDSKPMPPRAAILGEGSSFLVVLFATFLMSRIERRRFGTFGLGGTNRLRQFLAGLFWGLVCLSLLVGVLRWGGYLQFDARLLGGVAALRYGALWAVGFLFVALLEETMLRGYAQYTLARGLAGIYGAIFKGTRHRHALGFWTAGLLLSFVFGLGHSSNPGESPIGLLGAGLAGLVFCFALYRTGSLWWAIGLHASWDWAQSFLYGVADSGLMVEGRLFATQPVGKPLLSGGLTGPEGSIFAVVMLMMIAGIILVTLRQTHRPGEGLACPDGD
jgi:membrane protease YdiL (CAAX protease family)